jgi:AcrR family transcriptional regulator
MTKNEVDTKEKIVLCARALFLERGIKKTSIDEVAHRAGITRITVYRYFKDKQELVRETFLRVERVFQEGLAELKQNPVSGWESILDQIGENLSALPHGNVSTLSDEMKRLYPGVYVSIQEVRVSTLNGIFDHLFTLAEHQGLLRRGLNRQIVQAVFWELVINFFDNPRFRSFGLSDAELYNAIKNILLYGILKGEPVEKQLFDTLR